MEIVPTTIYKICEGSLWREARWRGVFHGDEVDLRDGFVHFSTAAQVRETAARHFGAIPGLMLVAIDVGSLHDALRWEPARGGDLFPHLYSVLPLAAVRWVRPLPLGDHGTHVFPELEP